MLPIDYGLTAFTFMTFLTFVIIDLMLVANKSIPKRTGEKLLGFEFLGIVFIALFIIYTRNMPPTVPYLTIFAYTSGFLLCSYFLYKKHMEDKL